MAYAKFACLALILTDCAGEVVHLGNGPIGFAGIGAAAGASAVAGAMAGAAKGGQSGSSSTGGASSNAGGGIGGTSGIVGAAGASACPQGQVDASEVLWIGDSWVTVPGLQHTRVRDLARASGAIGKDDDYAILAAPATTLTKVIAQYDSRQAGDVKVKVLVMDGGTWDLYLSGGSDVTVTKVSDAFEQFLGRIASDGTVEHIVYYLVPELAQVPGIAALRPHLEASCAQSKVPCHFLDLQPLWEEHPEYTAADGIQASEVGATVIAEEIWGIMRAHCIAQ